MAAEIKVPCRLAPHTSQNANAYYGRQVMTSNNFQPFGIVLPNAKDSRVNFWLASPIPTNINATPAGILRIEWVPGATGNLKLFLDASVATPDSTGLDISAGTLTANVTEAVASAANVLQETDIALTSLAASLTSGKTLFGWLERKASSDSADTVEASVTIVKVLFVANT